MKVRVGIDMGSWSFDPAHRTIALLDLPPLKLEQVLVISNVTAGVLIWNFADSAKTGSIYLNVLTLAHDTTAMSSSDRLYIDLEMPSEDTFQDLRDDLDTGRKYLSVLGSRDVLSQREDLSLETVDANLERVLGTERVFEPGKNAIRTREIPATGPVVAGNLPVLGSQLTIVLSGGYGSVILQISGTWTGVISYYGSASAGSNDQAIYGVSGVTMALSTTANALVRFNALGLQTITVRRTTFTTGIPYVTLVACDKVSVVSVASGALLAYGSQSQPLSQRASTYELNTYDTNMAVVLGTAQTVAPQAKDPAITPVAPTAAAATVTRLHAASPQIWPRLRVESGGSERLPFLQEANTGRLVATEPDTIRFLELILEQLRIQNSLLLQWMDHEGAFNARSGQEESLPL